MIKKEKIENSLTKLIHYCEQEEYKGYDPYDLQNSYLPITYLPQILQFFLTQLNKRSPINFRKLLKIDKETHTKGMGLLLSSYCNLYKIYKNTQYLEKCNNIFNWIKMNPSRYSKNLCWGFDYAYTNRNSRVEKGFPTMIHHSFILRGLFSFYEITKRTAVKELILKADKFIIEDIPLKKFNSGICFGYHPNAKGCCYNASLHAAESLAIINYFKKDNEYNNLIESAVDYVISKQKHSGVWYYSHNENSDNEKKQIDFHQGFILDSLFNISKLCSKNLSSKIYPVLIKGTEYYSTKQFDKYGKGLFRYPQKYPVDIHNQAQGIITFSNISNINKEYFKQATTILDWTIANMQDSNGYFYYQSYRFFKNKIPHIRWGQSWMLFAITEYLLNIPTIE